MEESDRRQRIAGAASIGFIALKLIGLGCSSVIVTTSLEKEELCIMGQRQEKPILGVTLTLDQLLGCTEQQLLEMVGRLISMIEKCVKKENHEQN